MDLNVQNNLLPCAGKTPQSYGYQPQQAPSPYGGPSQLFDDTSQYGDTSAGQPQNPGMQQPVFPGAQFVNDPMANMALQYGTSLASTGREFVDQKVCYLQLYHWHGFFFGGCKLLLVSCFNLRCHLQNIGLVYLAIHCSQALFLLYTVLIYRILLSSVC